MTTRNLSWWRAACTYRLRIEEEAFRFNTLSPPPPPRVWDDTTRLGYRLGHVRSHFAMFIPKWIARHYEVPLPPKPSTEN